MLAGDSSLNNRTHLLERLSGLHIYQLLFFEFQTRAEESQMASKENKYKYTNKEEEVSMTTSKKRRVFSDDT
jgi:hypothetical protein